MTSVIRTTSENPEFIALVSALDQDLAERDGDEHAFYQQFNGIDTLKYTIVAYSDKAPVGCGAIKEFDANTLEVKRMYVIPEFRGKGMAGQLLHELEQWALELGCNSCVLETGKRQPEAIALYTKNGYTNISNYGQYIGVENSVCFRKELVYQEKRPSSDF